MKVSAAAAGGLAGTIAVASLHQSLRRITADAPRMDLLNMELLRKCIKSMNADGLSETELQQWAVVGELVCDNVYYSLAGVGGKKGVWLRGALLGLVAGVTAVVLPKPLGLPEEPSGKTTATKLMTVGLYLVAGVVAAATAQLADGKK